MPTATSMMEKGEPDIAPELWINSVRIALDAATAEGRLHYAAEVLSDTGEEGWWIPQYLADANPDIVTVEDAQQDLIYFLNQKGMALLFIPVHQVGTAKLVLVTSFKHMTVKEKDLTQQILAQVELLPVLSLKHMKKARVGLVITGHQQLFQVSIQ